MLINDLMPARFFKAEDLAKPRVLTVAKVERANTAAKDKPAELKAVVYFEGEERGVVLNNERRDAFVDLFGTDTDDWCGKAVELFQGKTKFQGKPTPCISVRSPAKAAA